ncbi:MAG: transposase [Pirellula sp.]
MSCLATKDPEAILARPSVNSIARGYGPAYLKKYKDRMSADQVKTLFALMSCRSEAGGAMVYYCKSCGKTHVLPKSCGNRHCPTCQNDKAKQWLEKQLERKLPCPYFMITFTVPANFRDFARSHPRQCYPALFEAAKETLVALAKDPRFIGSSRIGMTAVLHTWGRDLCYHLHLHFIVPGGAISEDGQAWLSSGANFFVPVQAASNLFRGKYKAIMKRVGLLEDIDPHVWRKEWVVHSKPVGDGTASLKYLAPYVYRVAISNRRIVKVVDHPDGTGEVTYSYRPSGTQKYKRMTVSAEEFLRRFLQHVLPSGLRKVRHYGFLHPRSRFRPSWLRMLVTVTLNQEYQLIVPDPTTLPKPPKKPMLCDECGGELCFSRMIHSRVRSIDITGPPMATSVS